MRSDQNPVNRKRIVDFLGRVDRRLRGNEALELLTRGLWGLVGLLVILKLAGWWDSPTTRSVLLVGYVSVVTGVILWRVRLWPRRPRNLARSAAAADSVADLKDALKSALAFLGLGERTEWMDFQIERSADTADALFLVSTHGGTVFSKYELHGSVERDNQTFQGNLNKGTHHVLLKAQGGNITID